MTTTTTTTTTTSTPTTTPAPATLSIGSQIGIFIGGIILIITMVAPSSKCRNFILRKVRSWRVEKGEEAEENSLINLRELDVRRNRDISEQRVLRLRCFATLNEDLGEDDEDTV